MGISVPAASHSGQGQLQPKREGRHRWVLVHVHPVAEAEVRRATADGRAVHVDGVLPSVVRCYDCQGGLDAMDACCPAERPA